MPTDEQRRLLTDHLGDYIRTQPEWAQLAATLLNLAGELIVPCIEEDMQALLTHGRPSQPDEIITVDGQPSRCHENSAALHETDRSWMIVTGWACSDDGLWRHSWCERDRDGVRQLAETTEPRQKYFGMELTGDAAAQFAADCLW